MDGTILRFRERNVQCIQRPSRNVSNLPSSSTWKVEEKNMVSSDALESKMIKDEKERWTRAST